MPTPGPGQPKRTPRFWPVGSVILALTVLAAPRAAPGDDYTIQHWQTEDGLPQSSVLAIAQTPDGYLWLATFNGLARFDGVPFTVFDPENSPGLPSARLTGLFVDRAGGLWVTTETRAVARLWQGRFTTFGAAEGVPGCGAERVGGDDQGRVWLADARAGLHRWEGDRFVPMLDAADPAETPVAQILADREGNVWFKRGLRLGQLHAGHFLTLTAPGGAEDTSVAAAWPSREGGLWVITPTALRRYRHGRWTDASWPVVAFDSPVSGIAEDASGNLWVATYRHGLFRFDPTAGWQQLTEIAGLTTLSLRGLLCDREGNLWVGTDGGGLLRINPRSWKMVTRRDGLGINTVQSVCQDQHGRIWFAGGTKQPFWLAEGVVSAAIPAPQSDVMGSVWSVLAARDGAMWIGTYHAQAFCYRDGALTQCTPGRRGCWLGRCGRCLKTGTAPSGSAGLTGFAGSLRGK
jgi:ligand-binding sensor domain-containing protein